LRRDLLEGVAAVEHQITFTVINAEGTAAVGINLRLSLTECVTDYELPRQANSLSRK
jgi:hypothetical protein